MDRINRYLVTLITISIAMAATACDLTEEVTGSVQRSLAARSPMKITSENGSDVRMVGQARETVLLSTRISVHAASQAKAQRLVDRITADPPIEIRNDCLKLGDVANLNVENAKYRLWGVPLGSYWPLDLDFTVHMPKDHELKLTSGSGDLSVRDLQNSAQIHSRSGDADIKAVTGDVTVTTVSGDIDVTNAKSVTVTSTSGDVQLATVHGNTSIETGSGDITASHIDGSPKITTTSGDVAIKSAITRGSDWNIRARSGDVMLWLPADSAFNVSLHSQSGDVDIDLPDRSSILDFQTDTDHTVRGTVGTDPAATIEVHTWTGDIEIRPMP